MRAERYPGHILPNIRDIAKLRKALSLDEVLRLMDLERNATRAITRSFPVVELIVSLTLSPAVKERARVPEIVPRPRSARRSYGRSPVVVVSRV